MTKQCYKCRQSIAVGDSLSVLLLRLHGTQRDFGQYDYCPDCGRILAAALGLSAGERDALRLRGEEPTE